MDTHDQRPGDASADQHFAALFADGADDAAARVFAEVFSAGARSPQSFKSVRARVAALGGVTQKLRFLSTSAMAEPTYAAALEIALRWEHAYLAARIPNGDQGLFIVLLREGLRAQASADPYAAALSVLRGTARS